MSPKENIKLNDRMRPKCLNLASEHQNISACGAARRRNQRRDNEVMHCSNMIQCTETIRPVMWHAVVDFQRGR